MSSYRRPCSAPGYFRSLLWVGTVAMLAACAPPTAAPPPPPPIQQAAPTAVSQATGAAVSSPVASPVATGPIERAVLAKDARNFEPVDPTTVFRPNTKEIHLVGRTLNAPSSSKIKASWRTVEVPEQSGTNVIGEKELTLDGSRGFDFELTLRPPVPVGRYAVELSVNGQVAQTLPFSIVAPPIPVLARPENDLPDLPGASPQADPKPTNLQFIVDSSGSMEEVIRGVQKMDTAKEALHSLISSLPTNRPDINVGLRAFSHRVPVEQKARSCEDTELLVPMRGIEKEQLRRGVDTLNPLGWTPVAFAVQQAVRDFTPGEPQNVIVLVSDGGESCIDDPVPPILAAARPAGITIHVVGFDIGLEQDRAQLRAIAQGTGGVYVDARTASELAAALRRIATEQVQIVQVRSGAGQLTFEPPQGSTFYEW